MTPLQLANRYAQEHPAFSGLIVTVRTEPRGKGGWKRKDVQRVFVAHAGKAFKRRLYAGLPGPDRLRSNGVCECCLFISQELHLSHHTGIRPPALNCWGHVCDDCAAKIHLPTLREVPQITLRMDAFNE